MVHSVNPLLGVLLLTATLGLTTTTPQLSGYERGHDVNEVNLFNAQRQLRVNDIALRHGTGIGTAADDGVPGTGYHGTTHGHVGHNALHKTVTRPTGEGYHGNGGADHVGHKGLHKTVPGPTEYGHHGHGGYGDLHQTVPGPTGYGYHGNGGADQVGLKGLHKTVPGPTGYGYHGHVGHRDLHKIVPELTGYGYHGYDRDGHGYYGYGIHGTRRDIGGYNWQVHHQYQPFGYYGYNDLYRGY